MFVLIFESWKNNYVDISSVPWWNLANSSFEEIHFFSSNRFLHTQYTICMNI